MLHIAAARFFRSTRTHTSQTLAFLEGVFASKVLHVAFCRASVDDTRRSVTGTDNKQSIKDSERLVCVGGNANGTVTIKGLAIPSLSEVFSLRLVDAPTCVRVASSRPILAIGYADGTVHAITFGRDRCAKTLRKQYLGRL